MFLDEISEMAPPLQSKLLQVLQDGVFARLGGRQDVSVDVRVVAATNRDLERRSQDGQFREDLFFRLNVVCITLPPLRQRRDEIRPLTEHFLARYSEHYNKPPLAMATDTLRLFAEYEWPGNVRELENLVKRMVILGSDTAIRREVADAIAGRYLRVGPIPALQPPAPRRRGAAPAPAAGGAAPRRPPGPRTAFSGSLKDIGRSAAREAERELIYRTLSRRGGTAAKRRRSSASVTRRSFTRSRTRSWTKPREQNVLNTETFDFVLTNELKRALRSQNFVTLVLMEPRGGEPAAAVQRDRRPRQPRAARDRHARDRRDDGVDGPARCRPPELHAGHRARDGAPRALPVHDARRDRSRRGVLPHSRRRRRHAEARRGRGANRLTRQTPRGTASSIRGAHYEDCNV